MEREVTDAELAAESRELTVRNYLGPLPDHIHHADVLIPPDVPPDADLAAVLAGDPGREPFFAALHGGVDIQPGGQIVIADDFCEDIRRLVDLG